MKDSNYLKGRVFLIRKLTITFAALTVLLSLVPVSSQATLPSSYKIKFSIRGKGHGVGMSMAGVYGMAIHRKGYKEIVNYYYPRTTWTNTNDNDKVSVLCSDGARRTYTVKGYLYRLAEEPNSWPKEGLRALMVTARTYLRYKVKKFGYMPGGQNFIYTINPSKRPNIVAAVNDTAGKIKTYKGSPLIAAYSSSAGGYTAAFQDIWPGGSTYPYLTRRRSPYDRYVRSTWIYHKYITVRRIEKAFRGIGHINNIKVIKRNRRGSWGGRVLRVRIYGTRKTRDVNGWTFARALGINSTLFTFSLRPKLSLKATRYTVKKGRALIIYGYLIPRHNGKIIKTYIYKGRKRYARRGRLYGNSTTKSKYKWKFRPRTRGKYRLRSKFGGDRDHPSALSRTIIINVK